MWFTLFVWGVVAGAGSGGGNWQYDWRKLDEYKSKAGCERAATQLGLDTSRFRCIEKS